MSPRPLQAIANLEQNQPNPFKKNTTIFYTISANMSCKVSITILEENSYTVVKTLINVRQAKGRYQVRWDGTSDKGKMLPKGTYICKLSVGDLYMSRKIILDR